MTDLEKFEMEIRKQIELTEKLISAYDKLLELKLINDNNIENTNSL